MTKKTAVSPIEEPLKESVAENADKTKENSAQKWLEVDVQDGLIEAIAVALPDFSEKSPEEQRDILLAVRVTESFSGPLPPPSMFSEYEKILPGAADRIFTLAEGESLHRRSMQERALDSSVDYGRRGQNFGLFMGLSGIFSGLVIVALGTIFSSGTNSMVALAAGTLLSGGSLATIVSKFIDGPKKEKRQSSTKEESAEKNNDDKKTGEP